MFRIVARNTAWHSRDFIDETCLLAILFCHRQAPLNLTDTRHVLIKLHSVCYAEFVVQ